MNHELLIRNGFISIPTGQTVSLTDINDAQDVKANIATLASNFASYGYALSRSAMERVAGLDRAQLGQWWAAIKLALAEITGENRNMGDHIVYKNFPKEVLEMSVVESVVKQLFIYWGAPYDAVRQPEMPRAPLGDIAKLTVLAPSESDTAMRIFDNLVSMSNRWSDNQTAWANELYPHTALDLDAFGFKENGIALIAKHIFADFAPEVRVSTATDVLRLAAALSDQDISLRNKVVFRSFKRPERRRLLALLEGADHLGSDFAARPEISKRLLERLRPGDYNFVRCQAAYDALYNKRVKSFNALIDPQMPDIETLIAAESRPGEFLRRFHHLYGLFGDEAVARFVRVLPKLTTRQLVNFRAYMATINDRSTLIYPPRAAWNRAQIVENKKVKIAEAARDALDKAISAILRERLSAAFPEGIDLDPKAAQVKLQTNDQKLAEYGRGTVFDIPENMSFVRSASYWKTDRGCGVTWYDNGWNFFDSDWNPVGVCSWEYTNQKFDDGAVFSGDPVNLTDAEGKACQMIDLYIDRLAKAGVRYAVWSILCYSLRKFSEATGEVMGTLQWGTHADTGKVYEPSRAQMVFPLKSDAYTSYVAYIDVVERKLVYMDAPLRADVHGASLNQKNISEVMPAYVEYLRSLPSLHDLLRDVPEGTMPVLYSDADHIIDAPRGYVFRPENAENDFERLSVTDLIDAVPSEAKIAVAAE